MLTGYELRPSGRGLQEGERQVLGVYNYTVILTYIGMLTGFVGVSFTLAGDVKSALICLMIAGFCDMFDGKIASTMERTRQEKRFGVQIDSMSDLICFGVLPALAVYAAAGEGTLRLAAACLYVLCALIRLSWFNVDEEERQEQEGGSRHIYYGLPVTASALLFPVALGLCTLYDWPVKWVGPAVLAVTAAAFVTPFRIKKPRLPGQIVFVLIGVLALTIVILAWRKA